NLATSLFEHGRITTTETKAKRLRPYAERLITFAKRGDLHARRRVMTVIRDKSVVHELFTQIGPAMAERQGGYTRITKIGRRKGDNAPRPATGLVAGRGSPKRATGREAEKAPERAAKKAEQPVPGAAGGEETGAGEAAGEETPAATDEPAGSPAADGGQDDAA